LGLVVVASLIGCTLSKGTPTPEAGLDVTQAYQTVEARLTQSIALTPTQGITQAVTAFPSATQATPLGTSTPAPIIAPANQGTPTSSLPCDIAAPGNPLDVTIVDDTQMQPGQKFTKTWRLVNAGRCTWTSDYHAVWFFGAKLGDTLSIPLSGRVGPSESVEISVDMVAPTTPETYQSNWKLSNASGALFGIGPNGDSPFWVRIVVVNASTATITPSPQASRTPTPGGTATEAPTPTGTPVVRVSGTAMLHPGSSIDLDNNQLDPASGADVSYQEDVNKFHWLTPLSGAVIGLYGSTEPSQKACQSATMGPAPVAVENLSPGTYLCYRTDQGLPGWLRLNTVNDADFTITVNILTWSIP